MYHAASDVGIVRVLTSTSRGRRIVDKAVIEIDVALIGVRGRLLLVVVMTLDLLELVLLDLNSLGG